MNYSGISGVSSGNFGGQESATFHGPPGSFRANLEAGQRRVIEKFIIDISDEDRREFALPRLSNLSEQNQELFYELGPMLWFSFGTMAALVKEVISVYPSLSPPTLTLAQSGRVSSALLLLQSVAFHPDTKNAFVQSCIPLYLCPFIENTCQEEQFENLRYRSLGVIDRLLESLDYQVLLSVVQSELMGTIMRSTEIGSESSKTAATIIMLRIMLDDMGLDFLCSSTDRLRVVTTVLNNMVASLVGQSSYNRLKYIIACYLRLSATENGLLLLRYYLPIRLSDGTFHRYICRDKSASQWLYLLLKKVRGPQLQYNVMM